MVTSGESRTHGRRGWLALIPIGLIGGALAFLPPRVTTQALDICGCGAIPGLQPFNAADPATHPPGTTDDGTTVTLPVPEDGIFRFSSFTASTNLAFRRGSSNAPVTILVAGDVLLTYTGFPRSIVVSGAEGRAGNPSAAGVGGLGGPGGFRGGDGANRAINLAVTGGAGFGPGGGEPGHSTRCGALGGQFFGAPDLLPLLGGAGGGGGCSLDAASSSCSGGGGGGGGGALLIAANGTMTISNYNIHADGGAGGQTSNGSCAAGGAGGSGGVIRLLARRMVQNQPVNLYARGGGAGFLATSGTAGRIRLETLDSSSQSAFAADPPAQRVTGPTPLANPVGPSVTITAVAGNAVPALPQGVFGDIDVVVPVSGPTSVDLTTSGVPGGTTVQVTVKPRVGALPVSEVVPLSSCDGAGRCQATAVFNLAAGAYVVEARATFQTP